VSLIKAFSPSFGSFITLIKGDWQLLLFGFTLMFFSSPGQTYFISLFGGEIREQLSLSHGQFGAIYSVATLLSAITLLWTGALLDKLDLRRFTLSIVILMAGACLFMSVVQSALMLLLAIFLLRHLGQGLMSMTSSTTMMRYLGSNKGKANSLSNMGYSVAESVLPSVIILLLLSLNWRQAWQIVAAVFIVIVPVLLMRLSSQQPQMHQRYLNEQASLENNEQNNAYSRRQWTRAEVIRDPLLYLFVPALVSQSLLYTGFMFHQIHLVQQKGWPLLVWGGLYFLFSVTTIVSSLGIGALVDRVGAVRLAPFIALPMACGLFAVSTSNATVIAAVFMLMMGISTGAQAAISAPFYAERYGNKHYASIKSLASFIMVVMTAISPIIIGWFIDLGVDMNTLLFSGSIYALCVSSLGYLAYRFSLSKNY